MRMVWTSPSLHRLVADFELSTLTTLDAPGRLRHQWWYDKPNQGVGGTGDLNQPTASRKGQILLVRKEINGIGGAAGAFD